MRIHCAKLTDDAVVAIIAYDRYSDDILFNVSDIPTIRIADGDNIITYKKSQTLRWKKPDNNTDEYKFIGETWIGTISGKTTDIANDNTLLEPFRRQVKSMDHGYYRTTHYENILNYMKRTDTDIFFTIGDEPYVGTVHEEN